MPKQASVEHSVFLDPIEVTNKIAVLGKKSNQKIAYIFLVLKVILVIN
jgi:hypothetical protein